ncbi:MAG: uracil-xanthine permease [Erysipelotrichaceae bacterium]|nr:uracil-xanthine permease [Erysipelotrichaceae bacterium]
MKLVYGVSDKPSWGKTLVFALQQLLAIMAATIVVPVIVNGAVGSELSQSGALFGAGVGTLVYLLFTKFRSPVFLGSSFAFLGSMMAAFAGAASMAVGYLGLIIGAVFAGLVYVVIALLVKKFGVGWINKLMPAVVIGPTVAIIGLSLAGNAVGDVLTGSFIGEANNATVYVGLTCGLVTLFTTIACSVYGKKMVKMIPFIIGIGAGYALAAIFTAISYAGDSPEFLALRIIDFGKFNTDWSKWYPDFTFIKAFTGDLSGFNGTYIVTLIAAYVPVAFVVFAEHIADHKNLSSIIEHDLLEEPGLHRTLLGDGIGSMAGAFFGGACNTTYGESIGCVAISGNASVRTIFTTAIMAIVLSFILPFSILLSTIPSCVMGGVCIALYGFIAVSGLKMIKEVDLGDNRNLFVVSVILICGVGGMAISFGGNNEVTLTAVATALILGILTNLLVHRGDKKEEAQPAEKTEE